MKKDTSFRNLLMLRMIPREPHTTTAEILRERLADQGYSIHLRTIQRDLMKYSTRFGLLNWKSEDSRSTCWCWSKDASPWEIPEMNSMTALTFNLVEAFLKRVIPQSIMNYMNPHFRRAHHLLSHLKGSTWGGWTDKIHIISRGLSLIPPDIDQVVYETIFEAIIKESRIEIRYRKRNQSKSDTYHLNPLGLVFNQELIYLVATKVSKKTIQHFALHRVEAVSKTDYPAILPAGFDLESYVGQGVFDYKIGEEMILLKAAFEPEIAAHLYESKISPNQNLRRLESGQILLEATVADSSALRWWLLGFGDGVEVLEPAELRDEFRNTVQRMADMYGNKSGIR